jgi:hypothetical protein
VGQHLLCSLNFAFQLRPDRRSTAHLRALPDRGRYFKAAFRSLVTNACFQTPIPRSVLLAYFFHIHRTFAESVSVRCSGPPLQPPLPFGGFMPLRIVAFSQSGAPEAHLLKLPDFLSLPAALTHKMCWLRINVPGSLLPARFAASMYLLEHHHHAPNSRYSQMNSG